MYNLSICAVFKNESHILDEWLQHYIVRGVDHFYLVNDDSSDNFMDVLNNYSDKVTLFHNDILTKNVGRQVLIYEKYFRDILSSSKWFGIIDLDEFLYSPLNIDLSTILTKYDSYSQLQVDWLQFGSNGHIRQPSSVVSGFTKRANFDTSQTYYSYKCLFKGESLLEFNVHKNKVKGSTFHLKYHESVDLVINHYSIQSLDFFIKVKSTRGDINNWFDHVKLKRDEEIFKNYDINDEEDIRLMIQNNNLFY
jgi:hypothetical protein